MHLTRSTTARGHKVFHSTDPDWPDLMKIGCSYSVMLFTGVFYVDHGEETQDHVVTETSFFVYRHRWQLAVKYFNLNYKYRSDPVNLNDSLARFSFESSGYSNYTKSCNSNFSKIFEL